MNSDQRGSWRGSSAQIGSIIAGGRIEGAESGLFFDGECDCVVDEGRKGQPGALPTLPLDPISAVFAFDRQVTALAPPTINLMGKRDPHSVVVAHPSEML